METSASAFVDTLEVERQRLQNAVDHLQQSNRELRQAIEETGPDRDFKEAIEENIVVIAKYAARIERLDKEIAELRRGLQLLGEGEAILAAAGGSAASSGQQEQQQPPPQQQQVEQRAAGDEVMEEAEAGRQDAEPGAVSGGQPGGEQQGAGEQQGMWL